MNILKYLSFVFFLSILILIFTIVNLKTSYKYEVDLMETNIETDENYNSAEKKLEISKLLKRKIEIESKITKQKKYLKYNFYLLVLTILVILSIKLIAHPPDRLNL